MIEFLFIINLLPFPAAAFFGSTFAFFAGEAAPPPLPRFGGRPRPFFAPLAGDAAAAGAGAAFFGDSFGAGFSTFAAFAGAAATGAYSDKKIKL